MVSLISTASCSSYHHFIYPKTTPPLGLNNIAPISLLGFKQTSTTPKIVLVTNNNKTSTSGSGSGSGSGFSLSKEEEELERQVYEFMKNSNTPNDFPTKKQLLDAGRLDLVSAISNTGGWLAFGWDDDLDPPHPHFDTTSSFDDAKQELEAEDTGGGVDGILTRLHNHRIRTHQEYKAHHVADKSTPREVSTTYFSDFQAAEIDYGKKDLQDEMQQLHEVSPDHIRSRLQHMELELSSALHSLRSKSSLTLNSEVHDSSASELQQLSDVWEFQENELMKAEAKLRSIRAKLAVFEGKIALSVNDTQKLVEEKQRRIDSARRTLKLLRTTCIFWTHSASEVLLVGSFDGWTSQIKMEKTSTGIFSSSLKLYPGRYEIKFIVDGIWRVDPMLPVVHINGYENNSLVVRE